MDSINFRRVWTGLAFCAAGAAAQGPLTGVSIPVGSQDAPCWPVWAGVYAVSAPPYPLDVATGVGRLVKPDAVFVPGAFALHDHVYLAPHVPDPSRAVVDYAFRWPVAVYGVEIVQHTNGITQVEGFAGSSPATLVGGGPVFGPAGDVVGPTQLTEFVSHAFWLPAPACGTLFRLIVRKTSLSDGWANYRIYPLDGAGVRIPPASAPEALTAVVADASSSSGVHVDLQFAAGAAFAGAPYVFVGSVGGSCPGLAVPGVGTVPVVYDLFAAYTLLGPWAPETQGYQGLLDSAGFGTASVVVAPNAYPPLVGLTFTHAAVAVGGGAVVFSNPASFTVLP